MTDDTTLNDNSGSIGYLVKLGLSRLEASIYLALLTDGELNGYEVSKRLSLSRSNAYTALASLVEKGAAWTVAGTPTRYTAVPPKELCDNRQRRLKAVSDALLSSLPEKRETPGSFVTIVGAGRILDRLRALVSGAEERVYLAVEGDILKAILPEIQAILQNGKKAVIITDRPIASDAEARPFLAGATVHVGPCAKDRIRAIADSRFVLTGEISGGDRASCLYSDQKNLADIFKDALKAEIRLIELEGERAGVLAKDGLR
jgi:HTH-type transcriptional regulator, sugar sensing transcriptional regulator